MSPGTGTDSKALWLRSRSLNCFMLERFTSVANRSRFRETSSELSEVKCEAPLPLNDVNLSA